jgi:dienelactone hydrolase
MGEIPCNRSQKGAGSSFGPAIRYLITYNSRMRLVWARAWLGLLFLGPTFLLIKANVDEPLPTGVLLERVVCRNDPAQTYALYVPSTYSSEVPAPILYCFDPGARGRVPVALFRPAAERLGYIVVGSNNSRNGPWEPIRAAIEAMTTDTHERLTIDPRRIYTAGMSGGGGPAWALASTGLAGTIICASALDVGEDALKGVDFAFFGTAGIADFNFRFLDKHTETMLRLKKAARLEIFEGVHSWPPEEQATLGLEWLELQAMKSGRRTRDEAFITMFLEKDLSRAREYEERERLLTAFRAWRNISNDFGGLRDVSEAQARAETLSRSKQVRETRQQEVEMAQMQELRTQRLLDWRTIIETSRNSSLPTFREPGESPADSARRDLEQSLAALRRQVERKVNDRERIVSQRVLDEFYVNSVYHGRDLLARQSYPSAVVVFEVCALIRPGAAAVYFDLARAQAGRRDKKRACESLEKAIEAGYRDSEAIRNAPEFEKLREEKRFRELLNKAITR